MFISIITHYKPHTTTSNEKVFSFKKSSQHEVVLNDVDFALSILSICSLITGSIDEILATVCQ